MADVGHCWLDNSGNDANDGLISSRPVLTHAVAEAKADRAITIFLCGASGSPGAIGENISPASGKMVLIIGEDRGAANPRYGYSGANDASPIISLVSGSDIVLRGLTLYNSYNQPKSAIRINTDPSIVALKIVDFLQIVLQRAGQIGIESLASFGSKIENVVFQFSGAGPYTGSYHVVSNVAAIVSKLTFVNCAFIFTQNGGLFPAAQIYNQAGAVSGCRFYNCLWIEVNTVTGIYTIHTERRAYPPTAPLADRDPEPLTSFFSLGIDRIMELATRNVNDASIITDKAETELAILQNAISIKGLDDRDNTEIYDAIAAVSAGPQVSIDVPEKLIRPLAGSVKYRVVINLYDSAGNPLAPDSAPQIRITNYDESIVRVVATNMTQIVGQVGQYYYDYTITSLSTLEKETVRITVIENGITTYHREVTEIYAEGSSGSGTGSVVVDHNYGGVDNMRATNSITGAGVEGIYIYAFTQADWNAGNRDTRSVADGGFVRDQAITGSDGRWLKQMTLDPDTYVFLFSDAGGTYMINTKTVVVS